MDGLNQIIEHLKAMRPDMERLAKVGDQITDLMMVEHIKHASTVTCKELVDALADRVATLTGDASSLEDASFDLEQQIKADELDNPLLCAACNGSGEGQYDDTTCMTCKGKGTVARGAI